MITGRCLLTWYIPKIQKQAGEAGVQLVRFGLGEAVSVNIVNSCQ